MAVLNVGWMDIDGEQKAIGVGDDMPLTPVNTFAGVVASRAPGVGRRCALAVNDRCGRCRLAPKLAAGLTDQSFDDLTIQLSDADTKDSAQDKKRAVDKDDANLR